MSEPAALQNREPDVHAASTEKGEGIVAPELSKYTNEFIGTTVGTIRGPAAKTTREKSGYHLLMIMAKTLSLFLGGYNWYEAGEDAAGALHDVLASIVYRDGKYYSRLPTLEDEAMAADGAPAPKRRKTETVKLVEIQAGMVVQRVESGHFHY